MNKPYQIPYLPLQFKFESLVMYKHLTLASRALAELKLIQDLIFVMNFIKILKESLLKPQMTLIQDLE